jgi:hypothetical protein
VRKLLLPLLFISSVLAEEVIETPFQYTKKIHNELQKLKTLGPMDYFSKIDGFRTELEKYFEHKKRVCEGEFSTIILAPAEAERPDQKRQKKDEGSRKKLTKEERKLCFRELKALQVTYIHNLYLARKKFLVYLHRKRLKELEDSREAAIKRLQSSFSKGKRRN